MEVFLLRSFKQKKGTKKKTDPKGEIDSAQTSADESRGGLQGRNTPGNCPAFACLRRAPEFIMKGSWALAVKNTSKKLVQASKLLSNLGGLFLGAVPFGFPLTPLTTKTRVPTPKQKQPWSRRSPTDGKWPQSQRPNSLSAQLPPPTCTLHISRQGGWVPEGIRPVATVLLVPSLFTYTKGSPNA